MFQRSMFDAKKQHVACLAHVVNLAVQDLLGIGGLGAGAPEDVEDMVVDNGDDDVFVSFSIGQEPAIGMDNADNSDSDTEPLEDNLFIDNTVGNNASTKQALVKLNWTEKDQVGGDISQDSYVTIHHSSWCLQPTIVMTQTLLFMHFIQ